MKLFDVPQVNGAVLLMGWSVIAFAQGPPPQPTPSPAPAGSSIQFPSTVELVTVDAVVTDKKGNPIEGLGRDSFQVFEDGKPQAIASFEAVVLPPAPPSTPPKPRAISTNQSAENRNGRTFVIVFDDVHLQPFQSNRAKAAIDQFLKNGTRDGDRVTLLASGGGAWWSTRMPEGYRELTSLLKRLEGREIPDTGQDRVTEWEAMRIHIYRDKEVEARVSRRFETYGVNPGQSQRNQSDTGTGGTSFDGDPLVEGRASEVYYQATAKNKITLNAVERALGALAGAKGRKSLIMVGQGFIYDPNLDEFKNVVQASRRSNCAIYFVDTMGLGGMPVQMTAEFGPAMPSEDIGAAFAENLERSEGAESIAVDSGGFTVKNSNDLVKALQRIADETRVYYLIGYNPTNATRDGKFRKIDLKVAAKDVRVRARKGYYASMEGENKDARKAEAGPDHQFQEALDSPFEMSQIPIRMTAYVFDETLLGKASTILHADVDLSSFAFNEKEGRFADTVEFLLVVAHRDTGEFNRYDQKIDMNLRPETKAKYSKTWFPIQRDFDLLPGAYQAKLVIRDKNSLKMGTVIHDFEVPDLAAWRISTPVLTDSTQPVQPGAPQGPPKLIMLARREFETGARLFMQFDVYNPTKDKATGMPRVTAGYTIRRKSDGFVFLKVPPTMIQPTSLGRLSRMVGPPLDGAEPGEYEFELDLKDELSGKIMDYKEDFTVVAKGHGVSASGSNQN
jgi:VWFA-related protein